MRGGEFDGHRWGPRLVGYTKHALPPRPPPMPAPVIANKSPGQAAQDMSVILVTGSYDHEIRFWEAWSGICSRTITRSGETGVRSLLLLNTTDLSDWCLASKSSSHFTRVSTTRLFNNPILAHFTPPANVSSRPQFTRRSISTRSEAPLPLLCVFCPISDSYCIPLMFTLPS